MRIYVWSCCCLLACGGSPSTANDAAAGGTDARADGSVAETRITGALYGSPFTLQYATIQRASATDALNWLCIADIPVTYTECQATGGQNRIILLGPFIYDNGKPTWGIPQLWLYNVGSPYSNYASSGTLEVFVDNPTTGEFQARLDIVFDKEAQHTVGTVLIR